MRWLLISVSLTFLGALLAAPLVAVFTTAIAKGWNAYFSSFADPDTRAAIRLTLTTAAIVVPLNTVFGITAVVYRQVRVPRQEFPDHPDRSAAGGVAGGLGPGLRAVVRPQWLVRCLAAGARDQRVYALPGIVLATMFVTFPYVAREFHSAMQQLG